MNRDFKGIWIPREIWLNDRLGWVEKLFLVEIDSLDNEAGCFASNDYFAKFFGLSKRRVIDIINNLEKEGLISKEIIYKNGSKEVDKRVITLVKKSSSPYCIKVHEGGEQNFMGGGEEKCTDNNTRVNNTFNNTDDNCLLLQDTLNNISNRGEKSQKVVADNIYQFYQQNFGVLSPLVGEKLGGWVKDLGEELVKEALTKTLMNGSRSFSYAETIMREWYNKNIKTLEQVQALELDYQRRRNRFPTFKPIKSSEAAPRFAGVRRG